MVPSEDTPLWSDITFRILTNTVSYPIEYAKVLIQIGYEPIPPELSTTLFWKPALILPNVFKYANYIRKTSGFTGCYRGLVPKLCACTVNAAAYEKSNKLIKFNDEQNLDTTDECLKEEHEYRNCIYQFIRELLSSTVSIILSHPFDVITWRMMAQFVGGEFKYNGLFSSFVKIYQESGIGGYYAGIVPRLVGSAIGLLLVSSSTYVIEKYIIEDRSLKPLVNTTLCFIASTLTYPFIVVSRCMAVNNCGLAAGLPPQMPIYNNWLDCWSHLSAINQLKRGKSFVYRYHKVL